MAFTLTTCHMTSLCNLVGYVETACSEMAYQMAEYPSDLQPAMKRKFDAAKRRGVTDLSGWLADELYNDPDTVGDIVGDALYDFVYSESGHGMAKPGINATYKSHEDEEWVASVNYIQKKLSHVPSLTSRLLR